MTPPPATEMIRACQPCPASAPITLITVSQIPSLNWTRSSQIALPARCRALASPVVVTIQISPCSSFRQPVGDLADRDEQADRTDFQRINLS
jgi:hypothetical protein